MANRGPAKGTGGRPRVEIDWEEVKKLCQLQCTQQEICGWFGCSEATLVRRCKEEQNSTFEGFKKRNNSHGKISLRRAQFKAAVEDHNPTLLIWLGKQHLDQREPLKEVAIAVEESFDSLAGSAKDILKSRLIKLENS